MARRPSRPRDPDGDLFAGTRPWLDPACTSANRLPIGPTLVPDGSPWHRSLDGDWRFRRFDRPDVVPAEVARPDHDDSSWDVVSVPGAWTLQGHDAPHYTNVVMPFDADPPLVPGVDGGTNPTGVHRRSIVVPRDWAGRRVVLRVGGAESFLAVWVDGRAVGMATDSRLPSEFDLTGVVRPGRRSTVVLVVVRWSAQTWVEDQDQWWHAGLQRSVSLYATPRSHLSQVVLVPGLAEADPSCDTGTLRATVTVAGPAVREGGWSVELAVRTAGGRRIATSGRLEVPVWDGSSEASSLVSAMFVRPGVVEATLEARRIRPWSHEDPQRYAAVVALRDPSGEVVQQAELLTGFRSVEVRDRQLLVNGCPVPVHGVNLHEHDPHRGRAVDRALTRRDLLLMKAHHLNAVRTAHAPHAEHLAELCDELGLYVVDEADVESHGRQASLCHDPAYARTMVERVERMARRDAHHPSVVVWSLGNESGDGPPHAEAAAFLRRFDPSRPVQYEGPFMHDLHAEAPVSDVVCPMYTSIDDAVARARWPGDDRRPVILCEYSHAMGNSNGSLADYWEAVEATPGFQGGFIWEWLEHGIPLPGRGPDGGGVWGYGGDFGDTPNDGNFICDGLVSADRVPHPAMEEVRWVGRPVVTAVAGKDRVRVTNRRWFTSLADLRGTWELTVDGEVVEGGRLDVGALEPRTSVELAVPTRAPKGVAGHEAHLTFRWSARRRSDWAPSGAVVAWDQATLAPPRPERPAGTPLLLPDGAVTTAVAWTPTVFRALTDNDAIQVGWMADWSPHLAAWSALAHGPTDGVMAAVDVTGPDGDGWWRCTASFTLDEAHGDVPRLGVVAVLPATLDRLEWYGEGPHECYPDRRAAALVGRWSSTVAGQYVPYAFPQEHGHHTGLRWLRLGDATGGSGVDVVADPPGGLGFAARHHDDLELFAARHTSDLTPLDRPRHTVLHVDLVQRGLGTGSCGPDALERYRTTAGTHTMSFRFRRWG